MRKVNVIVGPTSCGKTSLAIDLCKKYGGEIVSADSRQVFKDMDIGTGKIPVKLNVNVQKSSNSWTVDGVVVWGYDLAFADKYFSAYDYAIWALPKIEEILEQGKNVFLVGGTGFFIDFVTGRVKPSQVQPDFELRKELETQTLDQLQKTLTSLNPQALESLDSKNPARLIRAIEIQTSKHPSPTPLSYLKDVNFEFIGLTASRNFLYTRSDNWLEAIWKNGLIDETKKLIDSGYSDTKSVNGIIYKSAKQFINGDLSEEEAKQQAKNNIHAYIRRQQTYFKKNNEIKWFDIENQGFAEQIEDTVQSD